MEEYLFNPEERAKVLSFLLVDNIKCHTCGESSDDWKMTLFGVNAQFACPNTDCGSAMPRSILKAIDSSTITSEFSTQTNFGEVDETVQKHMNDAKVEMMKPLKLSKFKEFTTNQKDSESGQKLDGGKYMAGVIEDFLPALKEVAKLGSMNNKPFGKYERGSWMNAPDAEVRYLDAFWRHQLEGRFNIDEETNLPHDVAIAWNALALLWMRLKREGINKPSLVPMVESCLQVGCPEYNFKKPLNCNLHPDDQCLLDIGAYTPTTICNKHHCKAYDEKYSNNCNKLECVYD